MAIKSQASHRLLNFNCFYNALIIVLTLSVKLSSKGDTIKNTVIYVLDLVSIISLN